MAFVLLKPYFFCVSTLLIFSFLPDFFGPKASFIISLSPVKNNNPQTEKHPRNIRGVPFLSVVQLLTVGKIFKCLLNFEDTENHNRTPKEGKYNL